MCDNHDDGETAAIILCNMCGNLCTDCDRFLHLHRRTRSHQRQVSFECHPSHFYQLLSLPQHLMFGLINRWWIDMCWFVCLLLLSGVQRRGGSHQGGPPRRLWEDEALLAHGSGRL